jgi:hypothetical protein
MNDPIEYSKGWPARPLVHPLHDKGEIVVTKTMTGEILAVTRQDDEGRILRVIAEAGKD